MAFLSPQRPKPHPLAHSLALFAALLALITAPLMAPGDALGDESFTYEVQDRINSAKETPNLTFTPPTDVHLVAVELLRDDGKAITIGHGALKAKETAKLEWDQPPGTHRYTGQLHFELSPGDRYSLPLDFGVTVGTPPTLKIPLGTVSEEEHTLKLTLSQPGDSVTVTVVDLKGDTLFKHHAELEGEPPGTAITLPWGPFDGEALRIDVVAHSLDGFPAAYSISPWRFTIPHEELIFPSGSSEIRPSESPKIDASYQEILKVLQTYGSVVDIRLYIAGYTDTVDTSAHNLTLSQARAKAIARALRSRGFKGEIYYQGFGESVLATQTGDNVEAEANRRALYVLAANPPSGADFPDAKWMALK